MAYKQPSLPHTALTNGNATYKVVQAPGQASLTANMPLLDPFKSLFAASLLSAYSISWMHQDAAKTNLAYVEANDPLAKAEYIEVGDV